MDLKTPGPDGFHTPLQSSGVPLLPELTYPEADSVHLQTDLSAHLALVSMLDFILKNIFCNRLKGMKSILLSGRYLI